MVALLDVDEPGHLARGEVVLVLEAGDVLAGGDPPVAVGVDPDEHVALREVGAVQLAGRMRAGAELEHDRGQAHAFDGRADGRPFLCEFAQGRTHEHPDPLVGRADHGLSRPSHEHIMAGSAAVRTSQADDSAGMSSSCTRSPPSANSVASRTDMALPRTRPASKIGAAGDWRTDATNG